MNRVLWLLPALLFACSSDEPVEPAPTIPERPAEAPEEDLQIPGFEDYVDAKQDTGYVGNRAAELEATFTGHVLVKQPGKTTEELQAIARALLDEPGSWTHREITAQVTEQTKYARNVLKAQKFDLNLEGGSPEFSDVLVLEGALELHYSVRVESLVKFKELEEQGLTPSDLVGRVIEPKLPKTPEGLFERTGAQCTRDPDTGGTVDPADLGAHNLFYYFDPSQDGCPLGEGDLITGRYAVESSLDAQTVYPEYDLLVADGRIDMVAIFGQITHGELKHNDWGFIAYNSFKRGFERRGFRLAERYPENTGVRLEKTYAGGLKVKIDLYTPVGYADEVPREEANERFRVAMRGNEIVYYNGHAFYGSLNVLDDPEAYPEGVYQIINMDACWSYAYYTKQIFRNLATEADPTGYALVDVVNNTEPGITGSERTGQVLYESIFKGAAAVHANADASLYSWNNIIKYMNDHAEERARRRTRYPDPEIYGVSGVRTNVWTPGGDEPEEPVEGERFEQTERLTIPDNDPTGAESTLHVEGVGSVSGLHIEVDLEHTYVSDLVVTLKHGERELVLHERTGGSSDDLHLRVDTEHFAGLEGNGEWSLHVSDRANLDEGAITSWALVF